MKLKGDTKFGEESTHRFKIGTRSFCKCDITGGSIMLQNRKNFSY